MRTVKVEDELEQIRFAERAARYFALHPEIHSVVDNDFTPGCLLALRGGIDKDCVMVVKLDAHFEPTNYQNIINVKRRLEEKE
ncbi:MAG: hypothetical protein IPK79_13375 [Vampirovibrionales bacterium]|jgi:hypothetical protein|nr:hypothetical protein [Vampirovibrionales bacterium]